PGSGPAVRVVRDLDHVCAGVLSAVGPGETQVERPTVGPQHFRQGGQRRVDLRVTVFGGADDRGVQPKRHVVHEHVPVHVGEVETPLNRIAVRVKRTNDVFSVEPQVECQVVPGTGGDDDHR